MDEEQKPEPKISLPEIIIVGAFILLVDIIDLIGLALGTPMSDVTDIIAWPASQLYVFLKGVRGTYMLLSNALEAIPYIGDLPLRSVAFAITAYLDHHPKLERSVTAVAGAVQGKVSASGEAAEGAKAPALEPKPATPAAETAPQEFATMPTMADVRGSMEAPPPDVAVSEEAVAA